MIVITGAAGFIGSCTVAWLNAAGREDLILVDDYSNLDKEANLKGKHFYVKTDRTLFPHTLENLAGDIEVVVHLGARTDTTEFNKDLLQELNTDYSRSVWAFCTKHGIPLIYASSAATYGDGLKGYSDQHDTTPGLQPLNPYGWSKQEFDEWVLTQKDTPPFWAGLKFFNVYGPNEFHKGRMASVIFHAFHQMAKKGEITLFRSHHPDFKDGYQLRDFIYVMDVVEVMGWLIDNQKQSGIYNLGTGNARAFHDLASSVAHAMKQELKINWVDIPEDIRDKYQYFTEADMHKLRDAGYDKPFTTLEKGVEDYVTNYLLPGKHY